MGRRWQWWLVVGLYGAAMAGAQTTAPASDTAACEEAPYAGAMRPVLMLEAAEPSGARSYDRGLLMREVMRQALLIAARDELGLRTRDQALREPFVTARDPRFGPVGMTTGPYGWEHYRANLTRTAGTGMGQLRLADVPYLRPEDCVQWLAMLTAAEEQSRGLMLRRLRQIGFEGPARSWGDGPAPAEVEKLLNQPDFVSQYLAVRRLHAELARQGDSEALLGALVRGYAHLGVLTDYFWNATHKVCKARALLYAQRMVAHNPQSAGALRHRAYALALSGLQGLAEQDLARADELAAGGTAPPWAAMVRAFCLYDWQRLGGDEWPDELRPLAALFALVSVETHAGNRLTIQAAQQLQERWPQCMRAYDSQCARAGVALGHQATVAGPKALAKLLAERLPALADLPSQVREGLPGDAEEYQRARTRRELAQLLVEAAEDDAQEPSWGALGRMIEEINFTQLGRRLYFVEYQWGLPQRSGREAVTAADAVGDHPYASYIHSYRYSGHDLRDELDKIKGVDETFGITPLLRHADRSGWSQRESVQEMRDRMYNHRDQIEPDVVRLAGDWDDAQQKMWFVGSLEQISPRSPYAVAQRIRHDWEHVKDQWARWTQEYAQQPLVAWALVPRLRETGREQEAMQLLERQAELVPDAWVFTQMAEIYLKRGEEGMWLATLERQLKHPDYGLEHTRTRDDMAWHFMRQGDFQRAQRYAETAAESWAGWAMETAAICDEAIGDWDRAEVWRQRISERYGSSAGQWYLWCLRTGYGDASDAYEAAEDAMRDAMNGRDSGGITAGDLAWCYRMNDDPTEALECLRRDFRENGRFWSGVQAMILAHRANNLEMRDELRGRLVEHSRRKWKPGRQAMDVFDAGWGRGGSGVDLKVYERCVEEMEEDDRVAAWAAMGAFLAEVGRGDEAQAYLAKALRQPKLDTSGYRWAWVEARERGLDPVALRGWPAPADRIKPEAAQTQPSATQPDATQPAPRHEDRPSRSGPPPAPI